MLNRLTREANDRLGGRLIINVKDDVHGIQTIAFKIMKHLIKRDTDRSNINNIAEEEWKIIIIDVRVTVHVKNCI